MAVEALQEEDKEKEGAVLQTAAPTASITGAPTSPAAPPAPAAPTGAAAQPRTGQGSGTFTNIQQYIQANKPKTAQLYKGITSDIQQQAGQLRGTAQQSRQEYLGEGGKLAGGQEFIKQQITQAGQPGAAEGDAERFQQLRTGAIKGPEFMEQQRQAQQLQARSQQLGTTEGRFGELQRMVGKQSPRYTTGQRSFDEMLMSRSPEAARQAMEASRQAVTGVGEEFTQTTADIEAQRQALQTQAQEELGTARTGLRGTIEERYAGLQAGLTPGGQLTEEQLATLGMERGARTYGADLAGALGETRGMSAQEAARLDALAKMAGKEGRSLYAGIEGGDLSAAMQERIAAGKTAYEKDIVAPKAKMAQMKQYEEKIVPMQAAITKELGRLDSWSGGQPATKEDMAKVQQMVDQLNAQTADLASKSGGAFGQAKYAIQSNDLGGFNVVDTTDPFNRRDTGLSSRGFGGIDPRKEAARKAAMAGYQQQLTGLETKYGGQFKDGGVVEWLNKQKKK
jgi:hypothetical protein